MIGRSLRRLAITALALLTSTACTRTQASSAAHPRTVDVELVARQRMHRNIQVVGTLAAADQVVITADVDGRVERILSDLGDRVHEGQPLVELDAGQLRNRLEQQRATLARALAGFGVTGRDQPLPPIEQTPGVKRTTAALAQAEQAWKHAAALNQRAIVSDEELEDAELKYTMALTARDSALEEARNLRVDIDAAQASVQLTERELLDTTIRAPFDGYVQQRQVTVGQFVSAQSAVLTLVRVDPLKLLAEVPERMMPWVHAGQEVTLALDAAAAHTREGTITRVSPAVDHSTRAFPIEATVPNADGAFRPGTAATALLASDLVEPMVTIPATAVQNRYGVDRVFVINGSRLAVREVKVGERLGDRIEIEQGLTDGDEVAISDVDGLAEAMPVVIGSETSATE
jgi:RND family efflux transporter MFP subunit